MNRVPGWTYFYSEILEMECAVRDTAYGPEMYTADKTHYLPFELRELAKAKKANPSAESPKQVHVIKRLFNGEIVAVLTDGGGTDGGRDYRASGEK